MHNSDTSVGISYNFVLNKHFAVFHEDRGFDYVTENTRCRIFCQGLAFNAVVNPFCVVLSIAEYVDSLFYRCFKHEFAFYLIVLASFTYAIIYRCVAFAVVPVFLCICKN